MRKQLSNILRADRIHRMNTKSRHTPGKNTGVASLSLFQGIFATQGSNPGLLHCRQILCHLSYQGRWIKINYALVLKMVNKKTRTWMRMVLSAIPTMTRWEEPKICHHRKGLAPGCLQRGAWTRPLHANTCRDGSATRVCVHSFGNAALCLQSRVTVKV